MLYSQELIEELYEKRAANRLGIAKLIEKCDAYAFQNPLAREYAVQGLARRCGLLLRCVDAVFDIAPPERKKPLSNSEAEEIEINIQAFFTNIYGCVDNLAWVWVSERNVTKSDGSPLQRVNVGLRKTNRDVRRSLPEGLREYLAELDEWFESLEEFRHDVAHGIPFHLPRYVIPAHLVSEYRTLSALLAQLAGARKLDEAIQVSYKIQSLGRFQPEIINPTKEYKNHFFLHIQMLVDIMTIEDIAKSLFLEVGQSPN